MGINNILKTYKVTVVGHASPHTQKIRTESEVLKRHIKTSEWGQGRKVFLEQSGLDLNFREVMVNSESYIQEYKNSIHALSV